jgi:hypothetical protein
MKDKDKRKEVLKLLRSQKIRDLKEIESYKLSVCHPHSAGIDLGSREIYVALSPSIAAEQGIPIVHVLIHIHKVCQLVKSCLLRVA